MFEADPVLAPGLTFKERVTLQAYRLYVEEGCPDDRGREHIRKATEWVQEALRLQARKKKSCRLLRPTAVGRRPRGKRVCSVTRSLPCNRQSALPTNGIILVDGPVRRQAHRPPCYGIEPE
jgi:hypothetical protein